MQIGHQLWHITMRCNQVIIHIKRMRGGVTDTVQPVDIGQFADQPAKPPNIAAVGFAMIGIHILSQQSHFTGAGCDQPPRLGKDRVHRTGKFRTACIGHNTKGAKFVTAFLHAQKGGGATRRMLTRQKVKFDLFWKIGVNRTLTACRVDFADKFRKPVIGLRPNHNIHPRRPAGDFFTFCLGNTAGNRNRQAAALLVGRPLLQLPQPAQFGKYLFRCLFTNMAGIQNDHIGIIDLIGRRIAKRCQNIGHAVRIINIHLTAIGFNKKFFGQRWYAIILHSKYKAPCNVLQ